MDQNNKSSNMIILNFVAYIPDVFVNLFYWHKALKSRSHLGNEDIIITIAKQNMVIKFNQIAHTKNGFITGLIIHPHAKQVATLAKIKLSYQKAHQILGHTGSQSTQ